MSLFFAACAVACASEGHVITWVLADLERNDFSVGRTRQWEALADSVLSLALESKTERSLTWVLSSVHRVIPSLQSSIGASPGCQ